MSQTTINFEIDENLKRDLESTCQSMGLTITAAFTIFAKKVISEQKIPFEIIGNPLYTEINKNLLDRRISDARAGINMSQHEIIEVE